jgi:ubiquinone/menaquinone biosynthesis C-methylase UbiE
MAYPTEPQREQPSTYFVQDRSNQEEMDRLEIQDKMTTAGMGGVLPEQPDPTRFRRVLDVGCGTGCWLLETAKTYPTIEKLFGADISDKMLSYARAKAHSQGVENRVQFQVMDALRMLEFPEASFDLVNQRAAFSWLRTWEWEKLLLEYQRVTRPGGIIRITEPHTWSGGNSPALTKLCDILLLAMHRAGHLFTANHDGMTRELARLMTEYGIEDVQTRLHSLVYRAGTAEFHYFYEDMVRFYRVAVPFLSKWTDVPSDYQEIYQQALKEMQEPDFFTTVTLVTAWGTRSQRR